MSRHKNEGWLGQWKRILRWYGKVQRIGNAKSPKTDGEEEHDIIYAFFQNCCHLRDWLIKSEGISNKILQDSVDSSIEMKICRDICN